MMITDFKLREGGILREKAGGKKTRGRY